MTIKIEFPADRADIAAALGAALQQIGRVPVVTAGAQIEVSEEDRAHMASLADQAPRRVYWLHHESEAFGIADSVEDVSPECDIVDEETYLKFKHEWAAAAEKAKAFDTNDTDYHEAVAAFENNEPQDHPAPDVDEKGVPFNGEFCGKAKVPFYGSGKKKGQWKKRQGVEESAYDDWYDEAVAEIKFGGDVVEEPDDSNLAANTFGNPQQRQPVDENAPQDVGALMKWVSEQQAAGNITQQDVTDAYTALELPFDAVMNPQYPVAENCAKIYNHLKGQI